MGRFAHVGASKDKISGKGSYFPNLSAKYRVRVCECKAVNKRAGGGMLFFVECEVLEIIMAPREASDSRGLTVPIVGETRSWCVNLSNDAGPVDLAAWAMLVSGEHDASEERIDQLCEAFVADDQPVAGMELIVATWNRPTKAKEPFTVHQWSLVGAASAQPTQAAHYPDELARPARTAAQPARPAPVLCKLCNANPVARPGGKLCGPCLADN